MTPLEVQLAALKVAHPAALITPLSTGAQLIEIPDYRLPRGWSESTVTLILLAPAGYPAAQPDCFWLESSSGQPIRLANGSTAQNTNDSNIIPGLGRARGTWFSWHLQLWNPNTDTLLRYLKVILKRLDPPR